MSYPVYLLPPDLDERALQARLAVLGAVTAAEPTRVDRCYLDTAGRRLMRGGRVLQAKQTGKSLALILEDLGNGKPTASCRAHALPRSATDLPPGALRLQLVTQVADEALLVLLRIDSVTWLLTVADDDGHPRVRALLECAHCRQAEGDVPKQMASRLSLIPVKGGEAVDVQARELLEADLGLQPCKVTRVMQAMSVLGMPG